MDKRRKFVIALMVILTLVSITHYSQSAWIHAKAVLAQKLLVTAWQQSMETGDDVPPWPWSDTWPVAQLSAPEHERHMVILNGGHGGSLPFAPGHMPGTVTPGDDGISMLVAHRDTHFSFLKELVVNDRLLITRRDKRVASYRVSSMRIIDLRKEEVRFKSMTSQLVLVTCFPFDAVEAGTPFRYVVTADAVTTPTLTRM